MAPTVLILSLLLSILSIQLALTSVCNPRDGTYGTPIDIHRTCSVYRDDSFSCMNNTFIHQWSALECGDEYRDQCIDSCPGFLGMNLTYECSFEGARLYRYKNGEYQYLNGSSVNYGLLLPEHAGLYECRNSANTEVHAQNITVNEEIRIGSHCKKFPYIDPRYMCCSSSSWSASSIGSSYEFAVYANPANNVSVTIEQIKWLVGKDARNGVDIGLYTLQNKTNPTIWKAGFRYIPYRVTDRHPSIKVLVTASTTNYSHSVCVTIDFKLEKAGLQIENTSLPLNTTVSAGQDAIFQCRYAYASTEDASHFLIKIDYSKPVVFGNTTTIETCSMYLSLSTPYNYTSDNCTMPPVKKAVIKINSISFVVEYTLRIPKVTADLSGSIVSCSVLKFSNHRLQWRTSAHLTITESTNITVTESAHVTVTDSVTEVSTSGSKFAAFVVIILPVIVVIVFLVQKCRQRRVLNQNGHLCRHTRLYESQSTLCDIESDEAVCVQISEINGVQRNGLMVGEQVPGNGVNNNGQTGVYSQRLIGFSDGRQSSPYQRDEPPDRTLELYDLSELTEFVVYISYTDATSEWVRNELKPLIELLHPVIRVNIHEDSMIPGFSVSGERHRLILGADKIVIVVSSDYASSEWCVYELEHAIHQKPALCNGRVIPILTENSNPLPQIIHGVVCLCSNEDNFKSRLHQAIFKKPNSMNSFSLHYN